MKIDSRARNFQNSKPLVILEANWWIEVTTCVTTGVGKFSSLPNKKKQLVPNGSCRNTQIDIEIGDYRAHARSTALSIWLMLRC